MSMRALLTGVPGWLGGRFLEILLNGPEKSGPINDWKIRYLALPGADTSSVEALCSGKVPEKVAGDITKTDSLHAAIKDVDIVFHMAGIIHPKRASDLFSINTLGTKNLLKESLDAGVKKFIYISSNSVVGTNAHHDRPMIESDEPRPYLAYGLSKYRAECAVMDAQATGKMDTVILRPCWFYGLNQPLRQSRFFKMIQKGNPLIFGSGRNLRSMTYIDNLCEAMLLASGSREASGRTYWIADKRPYSTNEIYQTIAELLEVKELKPVYLPDIVSESCLLADRMIQALGLYVQEIHVAGEMNKDIFCDIKKAREELGYDPKVDLREGMRRSIQWCRENNIL